MTPARLRGMLLGATAVLAALVFLAWSQPWFTLTVDSSAGEPELLVIRGDVACSALAPLALVVLALVAAFALAGPVLRRVFGVLEMLLGVCVILVTTVSLDDPLTVVSHAVTDATGIAGADAVAALVTDMTTSFWPTFAIVAGALIIVVGLFVAATASRWPVARSRKYSRTRMAAADGTPASDDAVAEWDALSEGNDPTNLDR